MKWILDLIVKAKITYTLIEKNRKSLQSWERQRFLRYKTKRMNYKRKNGKFDFTKNFKFLLFIFMNTDRHAPDWEKILAIRICIQDI